MTASWDRGCLRVELRLVRAPYPRVFEVRVRGCETPEPGMGLRVFPEPLSDRVPKTRRGPKARAEAAGRGLARPAGPRCAEGGVWCDSIFHLHIQFSSYKTLVTNTCHWPVGKMLSLSVREVCRHTHYLQCVTQKNGGKCYRTSRGVEKCYRPGQKKGGKCYRAWTGRGAVAPGIPETIRCQAVDIAVVYP